MNDPLEDFREGEAPAEPSRHSHASRGHGAQTLPEELLSAYLDLESIDGTAEHFADTPENAQLRRQVERWLAESSTNRQILHDLRAIRRELQALPVQSLDAQFSDRVLAAIRRKVDEGAAPSDEPSTPVAATTHVYRPTPKIPPMPAWRWFAAGVASTLAMMLLMAKLPGDSSAFLPGAFLPSPTITSRTVATHTESTKEYEVAHHDAAAAPRSAAPALPMAAPAASKESAPGSGPHDASAAGSAKRASADGSAKRASADALASTAQSERATGTGGFARSKDTNILNDVAESAAGAANNQWTDADGEATRSAGTAPPARQSAQAEDLADSLRELQPGNEPAILEIHVAVQDPNSGAFVVTQAMRSIDHAPRPLAASSPALGAALGAALGGGMKSGLAAKKQNGADVDRAADLVADEASPASDAVDSSTPAVAGAASPDIALGDVALADKASANTATDTKPFGQKHIADKNRKEKASLLLGRASVADRDNPSLAGESIDKQRRQSPPTGESSVVADPIAITALEVEASPEQVRHMLAVLDSAALGNSIVSSQLTVPGKSNDVKGLGVSAGEALVVGPSIAGARMAPPAVVESRLESDSSNALAAPADLAMQSERKASSAAPSAPSSDSVASSDVAPTVGASTPGASTPGASTPAVNRSVPVARNSARIPGGLAAKNRNPSLHPAGPPPAAASGFGGVGGSVSGPSRLSKSELRGTPLRESNSTDFRADVSGVAEQAGGRSQAERSKASGKASEPSNYYRATPRYRVRLVFVPVAPELPAPLPDAPTSGVPLPANKSQE